MTDFWGKNSQKGQYYVDGGKKGHLKRDPAANPPPETSTKTPLQKKKTMNIERIGRSTYFFVSRGWWMEGR